MSSGKKWDTKGLDNFDRLDYLYEIRGVLVNVTPLRVGRGKGEELGSAVDNPVIRDLNGIPFIPGSSLKGVLRVWAERIARKKFENIKDPWEIKEDSEYGLDPVEAIFGSTRIASHVYIYDSYPEGGVPKAEVRTGVSIDRFLGTSYPGLLYRTEYISPGYRWSFRMRILNINLENPRGDFEEEVVKILKSLLSLLRDGLHVGGRVSTGAGLIKLEDMKIIKYVFSDGRLVKKEVKIDV